MIIFTRICRKHYDTLTWTPHEVPLHLAPSESDLFKVNTVWLMVLVRYSYCNALSCLPSLFYLFSDTPRNDDCIDASQHDFYDFRNFTI